MSISDQNDPNGIGSNESDRQSAHEEFIKNLNQGPDNGDEGDKKKKKRRIFFWLSILAWVFFFGGIISFYALLNTIKAGKFGELPTAEIIENPENPLATTVYSSDGKVLGKYFTENRTNVTFDELSPHLVNALIATEDERFYNHSGIDFRALARVIFKTLLTGNSAGGGGSTLSQQLAKNLFSLRKIHNDNNIGIKKMQEWVIAVQLESKYTKEEILTMYLNTVDFQNASFGIYAAAKTYFNKEPKDLNEVESAALVGMLKATTYFNPKSNPKNNKARRATVFAQMLKNEVITSQEFDSLKQEDLHLHLNIEDHNEGQAPYFREQLRLFLSDWQKREGYNIYEDGLKVYTTIDSRLQEHAEVAMKKHMPFLQGEFFKHWKGMSLPWVKGVSLEKQVRWSQRYNWLIKRAKESHGGKPTKEEIEKDFGTPIPMKVFSWNGEIDTVMSPLDSVTYYKHFLQMGMMAMEPHTGNILVWVGGIDHHHFKYDHVNVNSKRQVGSTFKPFVYLSGLEAGYPPCTRAPNIPVVFDNIVTGYDSKGKPIFETWDARNSDGKYGGEMTLMQGLATSTNTITAWVIKQIGPKAAVDKARLLGITSHLEAVPSLCLGTFDISVYEMVGAFNAFNNNGFWVQPIFVTKIEDQFGNIVASFVPESKEAVDPVNNYAIVKMMEKVVQEGTGMRLISSKYYNIRTPLAGKTGTTQNAADGWFIGYEPGLTAGVWVGGEERTVAFRDMRQGQGARLAMPIFGEFMRAANEDENLNYGDVLEWPKPNASIPYDLNCEFLEYNPDEEDEEPRF